MTAALLTLLALFLLAALCHTAVHWHGEHTRRR